MGRVWRKQMSPPAAAAATEESGLHFFGDGRAASSDYVEDSVRVRAVRPSVRPPVPILQSIDDISMS